MFASDVLLSGGKEGIYRPFIAFLIGEKSSSKALFCYSFQTIGSVVCETFLSNN